MRRPTPLHPLPGVQWVFITDTNAASQHFDCSRSGVSQLLLCQCQINTAHMQCIARSGVTMPPYRILLHDSFFIYNDFKDILPLSLSLSISESWLWLLVSFLSFGRR